MGHADLTRGQGFRAINGQPVVRVAEETLKAGSQLVATWTSLEPIVTQLISQVREKVHLDDYTAPEALKLLQACGNVVQKLGSTGASLLRAAEGQSKLALLLEAGTVARPAPKAMSEKQMAVLVIETVKRIATETGGPCPICTKTIEVEPPDPPPVAA